MSINSRMKKADVYILSEKETLSGAKKSTWEKDDNIQITISQVGQYTSVEKFRHKETTHQGLTYCKNLQARKNRLESEGKKYEILEVDNQHRLAVLSLKEVELW